MTRAIFRKELKVLWASPLPFVLGAAMHATLGVLGWSQITTRGHAVFQPLVPIAGFLLVLVAPVLGSRSFALEIGSGTLDLLLAARVATWRLALGKYGAVAVTLITLLAPLLVFVVLLTWFGDPDKGPIAGGFVGLVLLALALCAVAVLASSLTRSQPLAAIGGLFAVLLLWFAHAGSDALEAGGFLASVSISERLRSFAGGLVDLHDIVFFVSVAISCVALTALAVHARRLR